MRENQHGRAIRSEQSAAGDPEKNVTHVHDARVAKHPIESLLRDRDQPDVNEVAEKEYEQKRGPLLRALRKERDRDAEQSVKSEFVYDSGMELRCVRWRGWVDRCHSG